MVQRVAAIVGIAGLVAGLGSVRFALSASGSPTTARGGVRLAANGGNLVRGRWQAWANASLVPTVKGRVTLRLTGCPAAPKAAGCVYAEHPRIVFVRPTASDPHAVLLHELGHVFDLTVLSDRDRSRFRAIMGVPAAPAWWEGEVPLAEWFAEGYSWCARRARIASIKRYAIYHYDPSPQQHRRVCALIKTAARDGTPPVPPVAPPAVTDDPAPPEVAPEELVPAPLAPVAVGPLPTAAPAAAPTRTPTPTPRSVPMPTPTPTSEATPAPEPTEAPEPTPTADSPARRVP